MSVHNTASLLFVVAAIVHVIMNWKVLIHYLQAKVGEFVRFKREMLIALAGVTGLVLLIAAHSLFIP